MYSLFNTLIKSSKVFRVLECSSGFIQRNFRRQNSICFRACNHDEFPFIAWYTQLHDKSNLDRNGSFFLFTSQRTRVMSIETRTKKLWINSLPVKHLIRPIIYRNSTWCRKLQATLFRVIL